jgi:nucleolar pre-ribosomal-associated protein 1
MNNKVRDALIELLHGLFNLHPHNTCQITHLEPLVRVYRGTLSKCDLRILSIFQLFEGRRKLSITPLVTLWSATPSSTATTALESLQTLDPVVVFRTCLGFPLWRRPVCQEFARANQEDVRLYDPVFLMLLFNQMIAVRPPSSAYSWLELFRTNVVSLFIRALSAKDAELRELALCQIVALWRRLEVGSMPLPANSMLI